MRKIFMAMLIALIVSVQNFCGAATIEKTCFNGNEKIIYPVVHTGDAAIDKKINTAIIAEVDRFLTGVYRNAQTNGYTVADVRTNYEVGSNEAGNTVILSIILTESNYYKGGAHPATYKHALNFNVNNGELMDISYLTDVGSGNPNFSLENVSKKLREHCEREGIHLFDDALPLKKLPENFYWDENLHVHLIFQHYEVAPYAAGIIDLDMH
ncbi:MAG: DUF4163 domain-containing protein [Selenomonadaceae bacterium]|nr:DUF4163 domain-containing protein [Selenomonadaceae bacterium]